jgi:hypothetical protein
MNEVEERERGTTAAEVRGGMFKARCREDA